MVCGLTFTEHVEKCVGVVPVSSDHNCLRAQLLRLPRLLDEGAATPLNKRDPSIRIFGFAVPANAELGASEDGIDLERIPGAQHRTMRGVQER